MQFKSLIRYPVDIRRAKRLLARKPAISQALTERPIVLDLRTPQMLFDCGRHFASLAHHARCAGSPFFVRCSQLLLSSIARKVHGRDMLADPAAQWIPPAQPLPVDALVLSDEPTSDSSHLTMMIGRDIDRQIPVMPYPMHPATLPHADATSLLALRASGPREPIFFAGNQKPKYGDARMQRNFRLLSRLEILGTLAAEFPLRVRASIPSSAPADSDSRQRPIVISDSRIDKIRAADWLPTLAKTQFFICCPGSSQPVCHNLVEAMSVGTIPIIEYGDRVTPELCDGENAICFRGRKGLIDAIERIESLTPNQISTLSSSAASFYDQHLCCTKFLRQLRDGELDLSSSRVCMPFHERNFYSLNQPVAA